MQSLRLRCITRDHRFDKLGNVWNIRIVEMNGRTKMNLRKILFRLRCRDRLAFDNHDWSCGRFSRLRLSNLRRLRRCRSACLVPGSQWNWSCHRFCNCLDFESSNWRASTTVALPDCFVKVVIRGCSNWHYCGGVWTGGRGVIVCGCGTRLTSASAACLCVFRESHACNNGKANRNRKKVRLHRLTSRQKLEHVRHKPQKQRAGLEPTPPSTQTR